MRLDTLWLDLTRAGIYIADTKASLNAYKDMPESEKRCCCSASRGSSVVPGGTDIDFDEWTGG
jgi:hypothetical protein